MKYSDTVQDEVRKTLDYLDKMPRLGGNPFLYTRIQARMTDGGSVKHSQKEERLWAAVRFALLLLLIVSNIATFVTTSQAPARTSFNREQVLSSMIDDNSTTGSSTLPTE